jgi:hypothetical protein
MKPDLAVFGAVFPHKATNGENRGEDDPHG